jgi:hypothetical protein
LPERLSGCHKQTMNEGGIGGTAFRWRSYRPALPVGRGVLRSASAGEYSCKHIGRMHMHSSDSKKS